tara:strand:+ start:2448 stop:2732 length:285 start_codon:yes stop_codon:yes gene_type:complete
MNHFEVERHLINELNAMNEKLQLLQGAINSPDLDSFFDAGDHGVNFRKTIVDSCQKAIMHLEIAHVNWRSATKAEHEKLLNRFQNLGDNVNVPT